MKLKINFKQTRATSVGGCNFTEFTGFYYYPQWPLAHEAAFSNNGAILFCLFIGDNQVQYRYCVCSVSNIICLNIHKLTKYKWLGLGWLQLNLEFA